MAAVALRTPRKTRLPRIHPTAEVSATATIGAGVQIWHHAQIREGAKIGDNCIIGKGVYIDSGVEIGANCKIQNYALVYSGAKLANGVFIGPAAILTNDRYPRAITLDNELKGELDWEEGTIEIEEGVSIGAGAVLVTGIRLGRYSTVGAGSVVTHDVPPHALMIGSPAHLCGWVCRCGRPLLTVKSCALCGESLEEVQT